MADNPKFTPGPWKVHDYEASFGQYNKARDVGPAGRMVARVCGAFEESEVGPEAEANARLIAAAPDLYEALKQALAYIEYSEAYAGKVLNAAGIEAAVKDVRERLDCVSIAHWGPPLASVDLKAARAALSKAEGRS